MNKICTLIFSTFICISAYCQDTIISTDGDIIPASNIKIIEEYSEIDYTNEKSKEKLIDLDDVFSIKDSTGTVTYIYKQNATIGNDFTIPEMERYILGIKDAKTNFRTKGSFIGGVLIGVASPFLFLRNIHVDNGNVKASYNGFYAPLIPLSYCTIITLTYPNKKIKKLANGEDVPYVQGYKTGVRNKRMKSSLLGSGIGLVAGYILINVIFSN